MISDDLSSKPVGASPLYSLTINPGKFIKILFFSLLGFEILLVFVDVALSQVRWTYVPPIILLFNFAREDSLGDWFASTQALFVGLVLWLIFLKVKRDFRRQAWGWALLATFFIYLAVDDGNQIHERIGITLEMMAQGKEVASAPFQFPSYTWQLVYGPFLGTMGVFIFIFSWKNLKDRTLRLLLVFALGCYAVAVGLDFIQGLENGVKFFAEAFSLSLETFLHFMKVFEEFLETLGTTFFLICFLKHFMRISQVFSVHFQP